MRSLLMLALSSLCALAACTWHWDAFEPRSDALDHADLARGEGGTDRSSRETSTDRSGDTSAAGCTFTGRWTFSDPQALSELNTAQGELEPFLAPDGLALYFARGSAPDLKVYRAERAAGGDARFTAVHEYREIGKAMRFAITPDGLTAYVSAPRDYPNATAADVDLFSAHRPNLSTPFSPSLFVRLSISSTAMDWDAYPSADGLELFYCYNPTAAVAQVMVARRAKTEDAFGSPVEVATTTGGVSANPAITADGRVLFFSSTRLIVPATTAPDLWYTVRQKNGEFLPAERVPGVNTAYADTEPYISPDGCWLYFASTRADGNQLDLYRARYIQLP